MSASSSTPCGRGVGEPCVLRLLSVHMFWPFLVSSGWIKSCSCSAGFGCTRRAAMHLRTRLYPQLAEDGEALLLSPSPSESENNSISPQSDRASILSLSELQRRRALKVGGSVGLYCDRSRSTRLKVSSRSILGHFNFHVLPLALFLIVFAIVAVCPFFVKAVLDLSLDVLAIGEWGVFEVANKGLQHLKYWQFALILAVLFAVHLCIQHEKKLFGLFPAIKKYPEACVPLKELVPARMCGGRRLCCIRPRQCRVACNPTRPGDCMWASVSHMVGCKARARFGPTRLRRLVSAELRRLLASTFAHDGQLLRSIVFRHYKLAENTSHQLFHRIALQHIKATKLGRWGSTDDLVLLRAVLARDFQIDFDPPVFDGEKKVFLTKQLPESAITLLWHRCTKAKDGQKAVGSGHVLLTGWGVP
eukprot:3614288-Amphidinium_carterae.1